MKTKFMISGAGLDVLRDSGASPALVVEVEWEQTLLAVPSAKCVCPRCLDQARPIDGRLISYHPSRG